jgi:gliding motility-associated lipoprotein GldD
MLCSCHQDYVPKPRGYFRIELPQKSYRHFDEGCAYSFDYPVYAEIVSDSLKDAQPCSPNVLFPQFNGRIHLTYLPVTHGKLLDEAIEDAYELAFKHVVKSTGIDRAIIAYPDRKIYGTLYTIEGNTASSVQFYLTDSLKNYVRGALYFREHPQIDSIRPVLNFIRKDVDVMIKSFRWKN